MWAESRTSKSAEPDATEQNSVEMEIEWFISITPVNRSKFPTACNWWRENHHLYPNVARVAKRCYSSAPPTSVASERLYSLASRVFTDRRNRLAPKKADMLLFIKHNLPLITFKYWVLRTWLWFNSKSTHRIDLLCKLQCLVSVLAINRRVTVVVLTADDRSKAPAAAAAVYIS